MMENPPPMDSSILPAGIRSRHVEGVNGLTMHILETGEPDRPCLLLLHGFPELAYSWRKVMGPLANAGYYVVAPDQRGYGRTTGWQGGYDDDPRSMSLFNLVRDQLALLSILGRDHVTAVIGHDFGSPVAACCALIRPDVFRAVALMSAPFGGPPELSEHGDPFDDPFEPGEHSSPIGPGPDFHAALANLDPPRKHYQWYYSTRKADGDMRNCPQGIHNFLRAYYHHKSADWAGNRTHPLKGWIAEELAKLPTYYIMEADKSMPATVAAEMPTESEIDRCAWLPDNELAVYAAEFGRTGFQGGLQWYRCATNPAISGELALFSGCHIDVPACFISGLADWGVFQAPGAFGDMKDVMRDLRITRFIEGAGHWVQQERPKEVIAALEVFLFRL